MFPPGLGNVLQLPEADVGPVTVPGGKFPCDAPKHKPHPQTSLGAVPALGELWAVLFPPFRQNLCSQVGFFVSPEGACPGWAVLKPRDSFPMLIRPGDACPLGIPAFPGLPFPGEGI